MVVGDEIYQLDGSSAVVTGSQFEKLDVPVKVYNLEIDDFHSYFVGDVPVLVHNRYENDETLSRKQQKQIDDLRNGKDISVNSVEEARTLLHNMPEVSPPPLGRMDPTFPDPKGTYRGDLIRTCPHRKNMV